jgi:hypothetical protein
MGYESGGGSIEQLAVYFVRKLLTKFKECGQQLSSRVVLRAAASDIFQIRRSSSCDRALQLRTLTSTSKVLRHISPNSRTLPAVAVPENPMCKTRLWVAACDTEDSTYASSGTGTLKNCLLMHQSRRLHIPSWRVACKVRMTIT